MKKTETGKKTFTKKEKLQIIAEAKRNGVKVTLQRYDFFRATYYYWKKKYAISGGSVLDHGSSKASLLRIKKLEKENEALKLLLGEKELESKLKDELLKKSIPI